MNKRVKNTITRALYEKGMTLKGYAHVKGLNYGSLRQVIHGGGKSIKIVEQLKKDGLWKLIKDNSKM
ncbi:MAG: hypothetical protein V3U74_02760 [Thermodesulfobacteriota bacterium]